MVILYSEISKLIKTDQGNLKRKLRASHNYSEISELIKSNQGNLKRKLRASHNYMFQGSSVQ